jgi:hypothetical protein
VRVKKAREKREIHMGKKGQFYMFLERKRGVACWKRAPTMLSMEIQLVGLCLMLKIRLYACNVCCVPINQTVSM